MRFLLMAFAILAGCSGAPPEGTAALDLESRRPRQMAEYYLGAYLAPDSVETVLTTGNTPALLVSHLRDLAPGLALALEPALEDGRVSLDELRSAVQNTYYEAIGAPPNLDGFMSANRVDADTSGWLRFEVSGSMTRYRRRLHIARTSVRRALSRTILDDAPLRFEPGDVVIGEHLEAGQVVETTAMLRRADGYWDFLAYDASGALTTSIAGETDALMVPFDCFGCHYGTRLFEPEKSFPANVGPGPFGERGIFVDDRYRNARAVALLDEHRRRTDGLLGLYATLYLSELLESVEGASGLDSLIAESAR